MVLRGPRRVTSIASGDYPGMQAKGTCWENLIKNQDIFSLVIISFILMTFMFDQVVTL